jgi:RNA polymerase sigma-70 factor (ECF subfamily)
MNESEIIATCLHGTEEDFKSIVDLYQGSLLAAALNILGNREDAEDVCQETFVQVYRNLSRFDPERSFKNWIFTILYRRSLDLLKKKRRFWSAFARAKNEVSPKGAVIPGNPGGKSGLSRKFLEQLSPRERTALTLWANEGFTAAEISEVLHCSASTARVFLYNARKKIKTLLEKNHAAFEMD